MVLASKFEHTAARADPRWMASEFFSPRPGQQGHRFFYFPIFFAPINPFACKEQMICDRLKFVSPPPGVMGPTVIVRI